MTGHVCAILNANQMATPIGNVGTIFADAIKREYASHILRLALIVLGRCVLLAPGNNGGHPRRPSKGSQRQVAVLNLATSALPTDLQAKLLLDQTLVVLGTEFGRTRRMNDGDGRDCQNKDFT